MALLFEWDPRKASVNLAKHKVPFVEAMTVFADPLARIFDDLEHSRTERREIIVGHSGKGSLLVVCFVEIRERVRLISARKASRAEETMKRTSHPEKLRVKSRAEKDAGDGPDEMPREYRFDYRKAKPNRFAERMSGGTVAVVLDPDVAAVFNSSESVNQLLRSVIQAMPDLKRDRD